MKFTQAVWKKTIDGKKNRVAVCYSISFKDIPKGDRDVCPLPAKDEVLAQ
jgi:hypothetical protein